MLDQDAVHGQLAALVREGLALGAFQAGVPAAGDECFVAFHPAGFQDVELGAARGDVGYGAGDGALLELVVDGGHGGKYVWGVTMEG